MATFTWTAIQLSPYMFQFICMLVELIGLEAPSACLRARNITIYLVENGNDNRVWGSHALSDARVPDPAPRPRVRAIKPCIMGLTGLRGRIEERAGRLHRHCADGAVGDLGAAVSSAAEPIVVSSCWLCV